MFYSQIILAKKGPLGQVWQAAHWGERKLGRPAVFSTDIAAITTSIANPVVPMALRVSGHLLLGIVRIYSRQVQFLLDDCHQAMIKVKMAYSSTSNTADVSSGGPMIDIALTTAASSTHVNKALNTSINALNVSNFGEYNDASTIPTNIHSKKNLNEMDNDYYMTTTTTHFAIPLEELLQRASAVQGVEHTEDDWVPAELDDSALHLSNNLLDVSTMAETSLHNSHLNNAADEEWGVFDPNDGEEEELKDGDESIEPREDDGSATQLSDIEVTRAVNDSGASDALRGTSMLQTNESAVASTVSDKGGESVDTTDFPMVLDDDDHQILMDDDDDSELARRRGSLRLSHRSSEGNDNAIGISFDASTDEEKVAKDMDYSTNVPATRRPRKRRKIVTDDGRTELSNDHIRAMLADTSDICREILHPATWTGGPPSSSGVGGASNTENEHLYRNCRLLWTSLTPPERLFCRPALADDGHMSPELLELFARNGAPILSQPFRYELISSSVEGNKTSDEKKEDEEEEEEEEIEATRHERDATHRDDSEDNLFPQPDDVADGFDPSFDTDGNNAIHFDEEDERMQTHEDVIPFDSPAGRSRQSIESIFSLGATNEMDNAVVDFDVATTEGDDYDASMTTTSKWHKNTIKVFEVLKKNLIPIPSDEDDNDEEAPNEKKRTVSYNALSEGVSRRTAAGFFFELLQLKTLNYIEVQQSESYGDIAISAGPKFMEDPPSQ